MDKRLGSPFRRPISVIEVRCLGRKSIRGSDTYKSDSGPAAKTLTGATAPSIALSVGWVPCGMFLGPVSHHSPNIAVRLTGQELRRKGSNQSGCRHLLDPRRYPIDFPRQLWWVW